MLETKHPSAYIKVQGMRQDEVFFGLMYSQIPANSTRLHQFYHVAQAAGKPPSRSCLSPRPEGLKPDPLRQAKY